MADAQQGGARAGRSAERRAGVPEGSGTTERVSAVSGTGPRGRYPKGVLRRQQILDRTMEVFADLGFENTSLRAIGEAIGVSHAALRRYFDTREELFLEVLREKDRRSLLEAHEAGVDLSGFGRLAARHALRTPGLMALRQSMVARALEPGNEHSQEFFRQRYGLLRRDARLVLASARAAGTVRDDLSLDTASALLIAALDGLSTQWLLDDDIDMAEGMALLEHLLAPPVS